MPRPTRDCSPVLLPCACPRIYVTTPYFIGKPSIPTAPNRPGSRDCGAPASKDDARCGVHVGHRHWHWKPLTDWARSWPRRSWTQRSYLSVRSRSRLTDVALWSPYIYVIASGEAMDRPEVAFFYSWLLSEASMASALEPPRVRIVAARIGPSLGATMKAERGSIRTRIQGPRGSAAVAA